MIAEVGSEAKSLEIFVRLRTDVVLLDLEMPEMDGV